ncbi:MAG TPA: hypothetical protein VJT70_05570, partial [Sphingomicrobium sp.]|nr:hypothetical protein [Sphingomicrobium sp.]
MIRVVALRKAALAGIAGAAVWEMAARAVLAAGVPTFDLVRGLGTLVFPHGPALAWWTTGMAAHALVGVCWAVFYAYFFWARFNWKPAIQGLAFAGVPATLALFIVGPQLRLMQLDVDEVQLTLPMLLPSLTVLQVVGLLAGHTIFGLVVGAIYTHPVGYRAKRPHPAHLAARRRRNGSAGERRADGGFIFATGIEGSYPTVDRGDWRRDELDGTRHYAFWQRDFELAREIGTTHLRYGPPLHLAFAGPGDYRWELVDEPMAELAEHGPEPIVDLCHFGLPDWLGDFQNPDF